MKKLLIFLMAFSLFAACNNDKGKLDKKADYREKDDYSNTDDKNNDEQSNDKSKKDEGTEDFTSNDGWSEKDNNKFFVDCMSGFVNNQDMGKKICPCALEKFQKKYSSYNDVETKSNEAEGNRIGAQCKQELNIDDNNVEVDNDKSNYNADSGWPEIEIKEFVTNCVKAAEKNGMEYLDAQSYCDCMQYKLEKLYPNVRDSRLTNLNMESSAMKKMVKSCLPGN